MHRPLQDARRNDHSVTPLRDRCVLVAGGIGAFTPAMSVGRSDHAGVLVADGSILPAGGHDAFTDGATPMHASAERWMPTAKPKKVGR